MDDATRIRPRTAAADAPVNVPPASRAADGTSTGIEGFRRRVPAAFESLRNRLGPYRDRAALVVRALSGLGWTVLASAVVLAVCGANLGWRELSYLAAVLGIIMILAALFAIGRTQLEVGFDLAPARIVIGDASAVRVSVRNVSSLPLISIGVEFRVGESSALFTLPPLGSGGVFEDVVVVPGQQRGVIPIGPVTTQRGDPFGLVRREVVWTEQVELFVHPVTTPLESFGAGLLRDLEGRTTQDISMSDLAFHTLRDYVPGDDRRYIHWRSTAKFSGLGEGERFLVRQFLDTRRSHIAVITDVEESAYRSAEEFELALSVGASLAVRTLTDGMDLTVVCGRHTALSPAPYLALDTYSRAGFEPCSLAEATGRMRQVAPDASVAILVTGANRKIAEYQRAQAYLPREVATLIIEVVRGAEIGLRSAGGLTVVTIGMLSDLPRVLADGRLV